MINSEWIKLSNGYYKCANCGHVIYSDDKGTFYNSHSYCGCCGACNNAFLHEYNKRIEQLSTQNKNYSKPTTEGEE